MDVEKVGCVSRFPTSSPQPQQALFPSYDFEQSFHFGMASAFDFALVRLYFEKRNSAPAFNAVEEFLAGQDDELGEGDTLYEYHLWWDGDLLYFACVPLLAIDNGLIRMNTGEHVDFDPTVF